MTYASSASRNDVRTRSPEYGSFVVQICTPGPRSATTSGSAPGVADLAAPELAQAESALRSETTAAARAATDGSRELPIVPYLRWVCIQTRMQRPRPARAA